MLRTLGERSYRLLKLHGTIMMLDCGVQQLLIHINVPTLNVPGTAIAESFKVVGGEEEDLRVAFVDLLFGIPAFVGRVALLDLVAESTLCIDEVTVVRRLELAMVL